MENSPLVSLIIPVFNVDFRLLDRSILSAALQNENKEILVIDDGSTTARSDIYRNICSKYKDVRYYRKENGGVSSARNFGLRMARGVWVGFLDADDELLPKYLEEAVGILEKSGADSVHGGYITDLGSLDAHNLQGYEPGEFYLFQGQSIDLLKRNLFDGGVAFRSLDLIGHEYRSCWSALYKREIAKSICFDESLHISEDGIFNFRYWCASKKVAIAGGQWYKYHLNDGSATRSIRMNALYELENTSLCLESLRKGEAIDVQKALVDGIVEHFKLGMIYTIAHRDFPRVAETGRLDYLRRMMDVPVFRRGFNRYEPSTLKHHVKKYFFCHGMARATFLMFLSNQTLDKLRRVLRSTCF